MTNKQSRQKLIAKVTTLLEAERYYEANAIIHKEGLKSDSLNKAYKLLKSKRYNEALKFVKKITNFSDGRWFVESVLRDRTVPIDLRDAVLQKFLDVQKSYSKDSSHWEHDLRALTPIMWEMRLMKWLEKFYLAVFQKNTQRRRSMYVAELAYQFAEYALWSDDPAKFGLTTKSLPRDNQLRESSFVLSRIRVSPFDSETDFLLWRLERATVSIGSLEYIHSKIMKSGETNIDTRKIIRLEKKIIEKHSRKLIGEIRTPLDSRIRIAVANDIDIIIKFLTKQAFDEKHYPKKATIGKGLPYAPEKKKNHSNR